MRGGDRVQNEIETARLRRHLRRIGGNHHLVRTEALTVRRLAGRRGEEDDVRPESLGKLHPHVAETTQSDDADFLPGTDFPVAHRRIGRDAGAEQRRGGGGIEIGGHPQHEVLRHDDALRITAERRRAEMLVGAAESHHHAVVAELFQPRAAVRTRAARVHEATHADGVADLEFRHPAADGRHAAHDFVAGHGRVLGEMPFIPREMQVGVADAAVENLDLHVARERLAALDHGRAQRGGGAGGGEGFGRIADGLGHRSRVLSDTIALAGEIAIVGKTIVHFLSSTPHRRQPTDARTPA